ncbi:MAG: hypothetical protein RI907_1275 [Pseudomonadota bacterium]|jgi:DNA-binding transcriptional LysR family regulator
MDRLQSMRVFEKVVSEGSFAAASRALDMSSPVVTRLVADLEEHLGTRLLQRTTRRLVLTDAGELYVSKVRNILQDIDEADALASAHTQELSGVLRIHAPPGLASYVLAPLLASFRLRYPRIRLDIEVRTAPEPPIEDFDITLLGADEQFDANVVARKVAEADWVLVASPSYLKGRPAPTTPAQLADHDVLKLTLPYGPQRLWRLWPSGASERAVEVDVQPVLQANHIDTLLRAALDGAGITSLATGVVSPHLARGDLVQVLPGWVTGRLAMYAALPSRKHIPQRTRVFMEHLLNQAGANLPCTAPSAPPGP